MATVITGPAIPVFRMRVLLSGLKLEMLGLRRSHSPSCYSIIKREFNLKGSRQKVYDHFLELIRREEEVHLGIENETPAV